MKNLIFENTIRVNNTSIRSEVKLPNNIVAYYTEVIPTNFFNKPYSYVYLNIQIKQEYLKEVKKLNGTVQAIRGHFSKND